MRFRYRVHGGTKRLQRALRKLSTMELHSLLDRYGRIGVNALASATPKETGRTAGSWSHSVVPTSEGYSIEFHNDHVNKGVNIAVILQLGHGTGTGGYVQGRDYINPAVREVFDQIVEDVIKEVRSRG